MQALRVLVGISFALFGLFLTLPILLITLPFSVVAWLTRVMAGWLEPRFVPWPQLIEFDPSIGWKPKPNLDVYYLSDRDPEVFHVVTDSDGWPGEATIAESEIVALGDSYAFGFGVDAKDSFAAPRSDLRIKSIGAPGYNMVQELMVMRDLAPSLRGKLIAWLVYYGNDLYDNLLPEMSGYRTPFVIQRENTGDWEIVATHLSRERWTCTGREVTNSYRVLAELHSRTPLAGRAFSACEFLIGLANEACAQAGAKLVVVGLPTPRTLSRAWLERLATHVGSGPPLEPDLPDREMARICDDLRIPFIAAREHLSASDFRPLDDHWNQRGHRRIRNLLREIHRDHGFAKDEANTLPAKER